MKLKQMYDHFNVCPSLQKKILPPPGLEPGWGGRSGRTADGRTNGRTGRTKIGPNGSLSVLVVDGVTKASKRPSSELIMTSCLKCVIIRIRKSESFSNETEGLNEQ
uniref:Uncharacterized protein n=2 Tax=Caenorhabditis japonica TaxID=281687 RepID=A0A8R1IUN5_CAEJA